MSFYSDASLVLIPSGIKAAKVYSQKPTNGTGDLDFSRASTATRTNASGLIEAVASNVPRLDYSDGATCPRLLLEGQRTNLQVYSEQFDNATGWRNLGTTVPVVTANQSLSPDGTNTADKIVIAAGSSFVRNNASIGSSGTQISSVYLKGEVGGETVYIFMIVNSIYSSLLCTLTTDWQRFSFSYSGGGVMRFGIGCDLTAGSGMVTQPAATIYAWGAQVEAGTFVSTYIPTTTATVTRLVDSALKTGISSLIGQTQGVLFWEGIVTQQTDIIAINRGTVNGVYITKGSGNLYRCSIYNSSNIITLNDTTVRTTNTKIALAYKSGNSALFVNGVKVATSASSITFSGALSEIRLNDNFLIASAPQSANQINVYGTRLTDAQCIELTTL